MNKATSYGTVGYLTPGNMLYLVLTIQYCHGSPTVITDGWRGRVAAVKTRKLKINVW